jgi:hypothetical protein
MLHSNSDWHMPEISEFQAFAVEWGAEMYMNDLVEGTHHGGKPVPGVGFTQYPSPPMHQFMPSSAPLPIIMSQKFQDGPSIHGSSVESAQTLLGSASMNSPGALASEIPSYHPSYETAPGMRMSASLPSISSAFYPIQPSATYLPFDRTHSAPLGTLIPVPEDPFAYFPKTTADFISDADDEEDNHSAQEGHFNNHTNNNSNITYSPVSAVLSESFGPVRHRHQKKHSLSPVARPIRSAARRAAEITAAVINEQDADCVSEEAALSSENSEKRQHGGRYAVHALTSSDDHHHLHAETSSHYGKKKHNPWSLEETSSLIEGVRVAGLGKWAEIKRLNISNIAETLSKRSPVDLKDKWRNFSRVARLPKAALKNRMQKNSDVPLDLILEVRELMEA